jgi:glycosyltransferase involved in cell wall biosynthesis
MIKEKVSIIIPAFNEEKIIKEVLNNIGEILSKEEIAGEIIVIDDGSKDKTYDVLLEFKDKIKIIRNSVNEGYGASIKQGIKKAEYANILIIDADGTYPVEKIPELLEHMGDYDMVVGSREGKNVHIPFLRRFAKFFIVNFANYLTQTKIPDLNSGFRIFKKEVANKYLSILPDGFSLTTTITLAMLVNKYKVKYVPIDYFKRVGRSKIKPINDTINFISLIIRSMLYFKPLRVFIPVSAVLFIITLGMLIYDILVINNIGDKTVMAAFIFLQVLILGMIADLIVKKLS